MATAITNKLSDRLREMADKMQATIDGKLASRLENTPKRQKEASAARFDGNHLARVQKALRLLADAHDAGTIPPELARLKTKAALMPMLKTKLDCSGGYYHIHDTGIYTDQSPAAVSLRHLLETGKTAADREAEARIAARQKIQQLENQVRFSNIPGFFPTPASIIEDMLDRANIQDGDLVLEPSAGKGDIADAIQSLGAGVMRLAVIEPVNSLREILEAKGHELIGSDFLEERGEWDRIVMNPPFERGQDAEHIMHAYSCLAEGGRVVSLLSAGPLIRSDKKSQAFREWLDKVGAEVEELPDGSFKGVGAFRETGVKVYMLVADRD